MQESGLKEDALKGNLEKIIRASRWMGGWQVPGHLPHPGLWHLGPGFQTGRERRARPAAEDRRTPGGHSSR
ncbi:unnamed protein product, partial [Rangifer tarandus platyrhynchus]